MNINFNNIKIKLEDKITRKKIELVGYLALAIILISTGAINHLITAAQGNKAICLGTIIVLALTIIYSLRTR